MLSYTHDNVTICFCCGLCAELTIFRAVEIMSLDNAADGHPSSKLTRHKFPDPHHSMLLGGDMYATAQFLKKDRCLSVNIVQRGQGWKTRHRFQFSFDEGGGCSCACPQILFIPPPKPACPPSYKPFLGRYKPAYKLSYKLFEFPYKPYKPLGWGSELINLFKMSLVCRHSREVCSTACSAASTVREQFVGNATRFVG